MTTKQDRILSLALRGLEPREIACETGFKNNYVNLAIQRLRKAEKLPAAKAGYVGVRVTIPDRLVPILQVTAEERGETVGVLIGRILENIIDDDLFSAVLDK